MPFHTLKKLEVSNACLALPQKLQLRIEVPLKVPHTFQGNPSIKGP